MERNLQIKYYRHEDQPFYSISLTEDGTVLASSSGIDENTVLHMFVTLAANALLNASSKSSLNDRFRVLERFASEIVFKQEY